MLGLKVYFIVSSMTKYLYIFFISMVPLIELRGAIPIAAAMGLKMIPSYIIAIIGNLIPVPFIYFFAQRVLIWGSDKKILSRPFSYILHKGEAAGNTLSKNGSAGRAVFFALLLFVGVPLPGTGAWTGCLAASILHVKFRKAFLAITLGVIMAGFIMAFGVVAVKYLHNL